MTETLERDSRSHPVTHWWRQSTGNSGSQFLDSSKGNVRSSFNEAGRQKLAHNLAIETFRVLDLYFTVDSNKAFLDSAAKLTGSKFLEAYLEDMPEEIANELVEVPKIAPTYAVPKETAKAKKCKDISETKLAKRPPEVEQIAPGKAMNSTQREALRRSRLSEEEKQAERDKKASRRKELRAAKKVNFCEVGIKMGRRHTMNPCAGLEN